MPASHAPPGYHSVTPYLLVSNIDAVIEFVEQAFDAQRVLRLVRPDGSVMHAEMRVDGSPIMFGEPGGQFESMPGQVFVYVEDCDAAYASALAAGGVSVMEPTLMVHAGERYGGVRDPGGNVWWIANHVEDLPPAEQQRRIEEIFGGEGG